MDDASGFDIETEPNLMFFNESGSLFLHYAFSPDDVQSSIKNSKKIYSSEVVKNVSKENYFIIKNNSFSKEILFAKDFYQNFNWRITNDKKEILGYMCKKAVGNFRGRQYTAWFTPSIPVDYGPWKFRGLPGVILSVQDEKKIIAFEAIKIVLNTELTEEIIVSKFVFKYPDDKEYMTYQKYIDIEKKHQKEMIERILSNQPKGMKVEIPEPRKFSIEKTFEWEDETKKPLLINNLHLT